jgi:hypothetical protein
MRFGCGANVWVLTLEAAATERIAHIVGQAGAGGTVIHNAALRIETAGAGARVNALVPKKEKNKNLFQMLGFSDTALQSRSIFVRLTPQVVKNVGASSKFFTNN